jgi:hypothetical protein
MYLVKSDSSRAVVPGFLLGYRGEAMMPEYSRYKTALPFDIMANIVVCSIGAYGIAVGSNRYVLMAYGIFMAVFSLKMFTRRLVQVRLHGISETATLAPLPLRLNTCLVAAALALMGTGFLRMNGEFDTVFFQVFGVTMIGLSIAALLALRRGKRN